MQNIQFETRETNLGVWCENFNNWGPSYIWSNRSFTHVHAIQLMKLRRQMLGRIGKIINWMEEHLLMYLCASRIIMRQDDLTEDERRKNNLKKQINFVSSSPYIFWRKLNREVVVVEERQSERKREREWCKELGKWRHHHYPLKIEKEKDPRSIEKKKEHILLTHIFSHVILITFISLSKVYRPVTITRRTDCRSLHMYYL